MLSLLLSLASKKKLDSVGEFKTSFAPFKFLVDNLAHLSFKFSFRFVTIDSSTSQQDLVTILLELRSKTICDEPIKARLKTQSSATQGAPIQGSSYNPYRTKSYQGYNNKHQIYSGDRASYPRKYNNKPFAKQRGVKDNDATGTYKGGNDKTKIEPKVSEKATPPPPLVEEHFPGLSGSPTSTIVDNDGEENRNDNEWKKEIVNASGYAAALLKAAPLIPEVPPKTEKRTLPKPKSPTRKVVRYDSSILVEFWSDDLFIRIAIND